MKKFLSSTEFQTGAFLGFSTTLLTFTYILTVKYTSNDLLNNIGFYRNGKVYQVVEKANIRQEQFYEKRQ